MEWRREVEQSRDLLRFHIIIEPEPKQQLIARLEGRDHLIEIQVELRLSQRKLGAERPGVWSIVQFQLLGDRVLESPTRAAQRAGFAAAMAAVTSPVEIEAQTPRDDDEPCRQLASRVGRKLAESPAVVGAKLLEHECVRVHRIVVTRRDRSRDVNEEARVLGDERTPRTIDTLAVVGARSMRLRGEQAIQ
jgi:hypothetical protein